MLDRKVEIRSRVFRAFPERFPVTSVGVVVCVLGGPFKESYMFVVRGDNPGRNELGLPAGRMEEGETPHEAAVRELKEETGVEIGLNDMNEAMVEPVLSASLEKIKPKTRVIYTCNIPFAGNLDSLSWFNSALSVTANNAPNRPLWYFDNHWDYKTSYAPVDGNLETKGLLLATRFGVGVIANSDSWEWVIKDPRFDPKCFMSDFTKRALKETVGEQFNPFGTHRHWMRNLRGTFEF